MTVAGITFQFYSHHLGNTVSKKYHLLNTESLLYLFLRLSFWISSSSILETMRNFYYKKLNSTEADKTCTFGISRINTKRTVRPKALVALAVAGGPRCYLPVTSGPEDGESAGVDVGAAGSVSRLLVTVHCTRTQRKRTEPAFAINYEDWQVNYVLIGC